MRYVAGMYIADDPEAWAWVVDSVRGHVIAAEEHPLGRKVKEPLLRMLRSPMWLRCFPSRQLPDVKGLVDDSRGNLYDLVMRRSHGKWIAFRSKEGFIRRYFPSRARWLKERWIRSRPAVVQVSPEIIGWDEAGLSSQERYLPGRPVRVHDLAEGLDVMYTLWPVLGKVFQTRTVTKPLRFPVSAKSGEGRRLLEGAGLGMLADDLEGQPVRQGLIHGDLQHPNVLLSDGTPYIIDWGDHFRLAPPLYDLFFYLFKHARSLSASAVAKAAFSDPHWIEEGLPGALEPRAVQASLARFSATLVRRYQFRNPRKRRALVPELRAYVQEIDRYLKVMPHSSSA